MLLYVHSSLHVLKLKQKVKNNSPMSQDEKLDWPFHSQV